VLYVGGWLEAQLGMSYVTYCLAGKMKIGDEVMAMEIENEKAEVEAGLEGG
jgi:hypothetical protein